MISVKALRSPFICCTEAKLPAVELRVHRSRADSDWRVDHSFRIHIWYSLKSGGSSPPPVMVKVTLNDTVLAESSNTVVVEGNHYFPPDSVKIDLMEPSDTR